MLLPGHFAHFCALSEGKQALLFMRWQLHFVVCAYVLPANGEKENIIEDADDQSESSDEDCNDDSTSQVTEIRFVPSDEASRKCFNAP